MQKKTTALLVSTGIAGVIAGGVLAGTMSANAADDSSSSGTSSTSSYGTPTAPGNGNTDPTKPMRSDEKLLTGDTASKVTAAVKAKYPTATFQRVETDSDGVYEAHLLVDGKPVTVEVGKSFTITGTEAAPTGGGDHDGDGPGAPAPGAQAPAA
jgi:hypothetical protein